jgi:hypothetical protein
MIGANRQKWGKMFRTQQQVRASRFSQVAKISDLVAREAGVELLRPGDITFCGIVKLGGSDKVPRSVAGSSGSKSASACLSSCLHQGGQG